jgi:DNA-binding NtrC family response regulator
MPALAERDGQRAAIAQALLPILAHRMGMETPQLDEPAARAIERAPWPGNLRQMRTVLSAMLAEHRAARPVSRAEIEAQLKRLRFTAPETVGDGEHRLHSVLGQLFEEGGLSLPELERSAYQAAVERAGGNLSAAARLLGLTRAQLAYRLGTNDATA